MLKQMEGSHAVAEAVALCRPEVICAYPISPQTHIVEGIGEMVKLGHGELTTGGRRKTSILADTTEALIGAMYLTDPAGAGVFVHHLFDPLVDLADHTGAALDWKTSLQEVCAALGEKPPEYEIAESGPDHDKRFVATAVVGERRFEPAQGHNKKQAEQRAAAHAFAVLEPETHTASSGSPNPGADA